MRWSFRVAGAFLAAALAAGGLSACELATKIPAGKLRIVAAFYPLQFLAERIGGDHVYVINLVKAGAEPHDLELAPRQVADISAAAVVLYLRGFQPAVDDAVRSEAKHAALDVAATQDLADDAAEENGKDPHIWLDPVRFAAIGDAVAERLAAADTAHAAQYRQRAAALRADLARLDADYAAGLHDCARRQIVTSHAAFGYLADRYRLQQVPISGLNPDQEPSPKRLAEVGALARAGGVTTIFFETLVSPKVAETLAREVGARSEVLDPIEGVEDVTREDYVSVMRSNLTQLRAALDCR
jgi:zinc transport system substrate-binding protein